MPKLADFLRSIADRIEYDTDRDDFKEMINKAELVSTDDVNIPDNFVSFSDKRLMTFEEAKENVGIDKHFKSKNTAFVHDIIEDLLEGDMFTDEDKDEINDVGQVKKKFSLINQKISKKLDDASSGGSSDDEIKKKLDILRQRAQDAEKKLSDANESHKLELEKEKSKGENLRMNLVLHGDISKFKITDKFPGGQKKLINAIADTFMSGNTEDYQDYIPRMKPDGTMGLFDKDDPESPYTNGSGQEVLPSEVLGKLCEQWVVKNPSKNHPLDGNDPDPTPAPRNEPTKQKPGSWNSIVQDKVSTGVEEMIQAAKDQE